MRIIWGWQLREEERNVDYTVQYLFPPLNKMSAFLIKGKQQQTNQPLLEKLYVGNA